MGGERGAEVDQRIGDIQGTGPETGKGATGIAGSPDQDPVRNTRRVINDLAQETGTDQNPETDIVIRTGGRKIGTTLRNLKGSETTPLNTRNTAGDPVADPASREELALSQNVCARTYKLFDNKI